jgi:hypothetical protein
MVTTQRSTMCMRYNKEASGCLLPKDCVPCAVRATHARDEPTNSVDVKVGGEVAVVTIFVPSPSSPQHTRPHIRRSHAR